MNATKLMAGTAAALAAVAVGIMAMQFFATRTAEADLKAAQEKRDALRAQISETENKIRRAQKLAADAEKDSGELLKAVKAVENAWARQGTRGAVNEGRGSNPSGVTVPGVKAQTEAARNSPGQGTVGFREVTIDGRKQRVYGPGNSPSDDEESQRLAQERAYQQDLARRRAEDAKRRSEFDGSLAQLSLAERFSLRVNAAEKFAAVAEFQSGIRMLNQAMAEKPADLPVSDNVRQLQATLRAQNSPVDVSFVSDGLTSVSVVGQKYLGKIETATAKILPGDYEVVGRRAGYQEFHVRLSVRAEVTPSVVTVACTQPLMPR